MMNSNQIMERGYALQGGEDFIFSIDGSDYKIVKHSFIDRSKDKMSFFCNIQFTRKNSYSSPRSILHNRGEEDSFLGD